MSSHEVVISFAETLIAQSDFSIVEGYYCPETLQTILTRVLTHLATQSQLSVEVSAFLAKPCELEVYVTDLTEGRELNLEARGKDYATNILSYPSELPESVLTLLPTVLLGELVICHAVVATQAAEQGKSVSDHLTHLIIHGILHLLGFDHELGQAEQDEMEALEIAVLATFEIANPYE